jgi:hypothetical protein
MQSIGVNIYLLTVYDATQHIKQKTSLIFSSSISYSSNEINRITTLSIIIVEDPVEFKGTVALHQKKDLQIEFVALAGCCTKDWHTQ